MVVNSRLGADNKLKVAVLMPAWNAARYIRDAIESVLVQRDAARFDIIVADDGSADATRNIVGELSATASEVRLLPLAHRGLPLTRNAALDAVAPDTDIVTFLDSDDLSPPSRFARDLATFDPDADVHWGMTQRFTDHANREGKAQLERGSQLGAVMIRVSRFEALPRFNEAYGLGEDVDFLLRLLETRPSLKLTNDVAVLYREHATNTTRDKLAVRHALTRVYLAAAHRRKHGAPAVPHGLFQPRSWEA